MKEIRILLLEDNTMDMRVIEQVLKKSGTSFTLQTVTNKDDFEKALKECRPEVVLCDHVLPDFDSYQALVLVRETDPHIPFIVVTGAGNEQFAVSILNEGADDYILKKSMERLPAAILASLKRRQTEARLIASEKKFRTLIENSYDIIALKDRQMQVTYSSPSVKRITGWQKENESFLKHSHPDDQIRMKRIMKEVMANPDHPLFSTFRVKHEKGHYIWLEGTITNKLHNPFIEAIVVNLRDVTDQIESYESLLRSEAELRNFAKHLNTIQEEERTRIAREIHDELGQHFASIKFAISSLRKSVQNESLAHQIDEISNDVNRCSQQLRKIATDLRPGILDTLGLAPSIEWLASEFQKKSGITCRTRVEVSQSVCDPDISTCFFRICQESLTNISKHANASEVSISLYEQDGQLNLRVEDNGKGMPGESGANPFSMGLMGMRERAKAIDAQLEISSEPGRGTTVYLRTKQGLRQTVVEPLGK